MLLQNMWEKYLPQGSPQARFAGDVLFVIPFSSMLWVSVVKVMWRNLQTDHMNDSIVLDEYIRFDTHIQLEHVYGFLSNNDIIDTVIMRLTWTVRMIFDSLLTLVILALLMICGKIATTGGSHHRILHSFDVYSLLAMNAQKHFLAISSRVNEYWIAVIEVKI